MSEPMVAQLFRKTEDAEIFLDDRSVNNYTIDVSAILYFQRKITGAALISSKYWCIRLRFSHEPCPKYVRVSREVCAEWLSSSKRILWCGG